MNGELRPEDGDDGADELAATESLRKRRTKRHLFLSLAAIVIFGSSFAALYYQTQDEPEPPPTPTRSPSASPTVADVQPTILVQATGDEGATANMLTGVGAGPEPRAILISMPGDLILNGATPGSSLYMPLADIDTRSVGPIMSATLGVRIDGSWNMDRKAYAGLIDSIGGVSVTVPQRTRVRDGSGQVVLALPPGRSQLTGADGSWYAVGTINDETPSAAEARAALVFNEVLQGLPTNTTAVRETLTSLGALAPATIPTQDLADYLVQLTTAMRTGETDAFRLPTTTIPIGRDKFEWTDFAQATPLLRRSLPLAQWSTQDGNPPRVLVMNGTARPGYIGSTRAAIAGLGFLFVDGRGTPTSARSQSEVQVRGVQPWGKQVAAALDLPDSAITSQPVREQPDGPPWANVDVTLGQDYSP